MSRRDARIVTVTLPDGTTATRRTTKRAYTHVLAALKPGPRWCALVWSGSLVNAQKAVKTWARVFEKVEIVNVNTREQDLLAAIKVAEETCRAAASVHREAEEALDAFRVTLRPSYPTEAHKLGIAEAARRVAGRVEANNHLGDPCGPEADRYAVVVSGDEGYLSVRHNAPTSVRNGSSLWSFLPSEVQEIEGLLDLAELNVVSSWVHHEGLSFRVKVRYPA